MEGFRPEVEHRPTAADNFRSMIRKMQEVAESPGLAQRRVARRESLQLAVGVISAPEQERRELAGAFGILAVSQPETAQAAYRTLLAARVVRAVALRELLELPSRGLILPRQK